jgi:hypothetical protein
VIPAYLGKKGRRGNDPVFYYFSLYIAIVTVPGAKVYDKS